MSSPFKLDGQNIILEAEYAEAYIPTSLFKTKADDTALPSSIAYINGDGFTILGIFYMRIFSSENQNRETVKLQTLAYPNMIDTYPSESTKLKLSINDDEDTYRVLKYYKGDIVMKSETTKSVLNVETFNRLILSGKIPPSLLYNNIFQQWFDSFDMNDINSQVPAVLLQMFISVVCRDVNDLGTEFRKLVGKDPSKNKPMAYRSIDTNMVSSFGSTMSALSFERITDKITSAINMEKEGTEQKRSPVEDVLYY